MAEMTPLEAAEIILNPHGYGTSERNAAECLADSYLRAIAAGEYKPVVHGRWRKVSDDFLDVGDAFFCSECDEPQEKISRFCPSCGALMDESREGNSLNGKDDSYETN